MAAKSPEGLTTLFEQIAGSDALKAQYEELQAGKEEAEARCALLFAKKKGISQEKRQKKEQKDEAERHMRTQQELVGGRFMSAACRSAFAELHMWAEDAAGAAGGSSAPAASLSAQLCMWGAQPGCVLQPALR